MQVLVNFLDGTSQSAIWVTTGPDAGGDDGTNWGVWGILSTSRNAKFSRLR
jgi:hypothetical protein